MAKDTKAPPAQPRPIKDSGGRGIAQDGKITRDLGPREPPPPPPGSTGKKKD